MKNPFKKQDSLLRELNMLPPNTKKRILENVYRRSNEILEQKLIEKQVKVYNDSEDVSSKRTWRAFNDGMKKRREELKKKGIIKPVIRYNKENFVSPIEEASKKARKDEIKRIESQRNKLKAGYSANNNPKLKLKKLKLKAGKTLNF